MLVINLKNRVKLSGVAGAVNCRVRKFILYYIVLKTLRFLSFTFLFLLPRIQGYQFFLSRVPLNS